MTLSTLLYVSDLAPDTSISAIAAIAREARFRNAEDDLTGLLTFDGARFCQLVEGPVIKLSSLLERLRRDTRHQDMEILNLDRLEGDRLFSNWRLGFIERPVRPGIDELKGLRGKDAIAAFKRTLPPLSPDVWMTLP